MEKTYIIIAWPKNNIEKIVITHGVSEKDEDMGPMLFKTMGQAYRMISTIQKGWDYMLIEVKGEVDWMVNLSTEEFLKLTKLED